VKKLLIGTALAVMLAGGMVFVQGCSKEQVQQTVQQNKPAILKLVETGASRGSYEGLKAWAKKNPEAAKEAAVALAGNLDNFLGYLNGGNLGTSEEVEALMSSSLFKNVPDEVKTAILAASAVLDLYLPVPSASTSLNQDQVDYLKAFVTGLKKGVADFNSKDIKRNWLH
jgi:hypothetical protein